MILACLAHCAGKPVCVCAQNGGKAGNLGLFPLPAEDGAVHGAALCSVLGIPEDAALAGAERLTRSLALRLPELFRGERDGRDKRDFCFRMGTGGHAVS